MDMHSAKMQNGNYANNEYANGVPLSPDSSSQHPRRAKRPIPDDLKDNRYWQKRKRNNEAAKKSREAKRNQEYTIRERMLICEQENAMLRQELARLRADRDASRLALANEGHHVPYNPADHNNSTDYGERPPVGNAMPQRMNLPPMQTFQTPPSQESSYENGDTHEPKLAPMYGAPPFQYGSPFGFYVAAYGQSYRYPMPVSTPENGVNHYPQSTTTTHTPPVSDRSTDGSPCATPSAIYEKEEREKSQSTTDKVDEIRAENADLKTKLRDLEQAVSYMRDISHQQVKSPRGDED